MPRTLPSRRAPRHHLMLHRPMNRPLHRPLHHRAHGPEPAPLRTSDLVLALLGVVLLGGLALAAAVTLAAGTPAP